ncbi:MAG TPA: hypothetical protein VHB98_01750, partial [Chloroflexota bacterium]|nr:hypothetical protein [Chloroflexota bacterium]
MQQRYGRCSTYRLGAIIARVGLALSLAVLARPLSFATAAPAHSAARHALRFTPQQDFPTNLPTRLVHPGTVLVAFRAPVNVVGTHIALAGGQGQFSTAAATSLSATLDALHTTRIVHILQGLPVDRLNAARARAEAATGRYITDFTQLYLVNFDPAINDGAAANRLARSPLVSSAMPDFLYHTPLHQAARAPAATRQAAAITTTTPGVAAATLPPNYSY